MVQTNDERVLGVLYYGGHDLEPSMTCIPEERWNMDVIPYGYNFDNDEFEYEYLDVIEDSSSNTPHGCKY